MDIRHPFKEDDINLIDWCESQNLPMILLLNKADKLSKNKVAQALSGAKKNLEELSVKHHIIAVSAINKTGIDRLLEKINELN
jgi:GTP-binding protein